MVEADCFISELQKIELSRKTITMVHLSKIYPQDRAH